MREARNPFRFDSPDAGMRRQARRFARRSIYVREIRYSGRRYRFRSVTVDRLAQFSDAEAARLLRALAPRMTRAQHEARAERSEHAAALTAQRYARAVSAAFREHFGREPEATDYKIAGVWRDDFPLSVKRRLRALLSAETALRERADAHAHAARHFRNLPEA